MNLIFLLSALIAFLTPISSLADNDVITLNADMMTEGKEFIVRETFDLHGDTIEIPNDVILNFKGGTISNGHIKGQNTKILAKRSLIFSNISVEGSWLVKDIYSEWFDFGDDVDRNTTNFKNICSLADGDLANNIYVKEGVYNVRITRNNGSVISVPNNTSLFINGDIILQANNFPCYAIINVYNRENIRVEGRGCLTGDVETHTGNDGEWGMGINIVSSKNVIVKDLTIRNCWGDCIYIGQSKDIRESFSESITIKNVICDSGRRQGLSLITGKNIRILDSEFINTGSIKFTAPGFGLDIEPNIDDAVVENVLIENCRFYGNKIPKAGDLVSYRLNKTCSVIIRKCTFERYVALGKWSYNINFVDCKFNRFAVNDESANIRVENSIINERGKSRNVVFNKCKIIKDETLLGNNTILIGGCGLAALVSVFFLLRKRNA